MIMAVAWAAAEKVADSGGSFFAKIGSFLQSTNLPEQIKDVDAAGLFSNPWFIIPFVAMVGYMLWKQQFTELIVTALLVTIWWLSGTEYMQSLVVNGEVQIKKVLPVLGVASAALGFVVYLIFGRS